MTACLLAENFWDAMCMYVIPIHRLMSGFRGDFFSATTYSPESIVELVMVSYTGLSMKSLSLNNWSQNDFLVNFSFRRLNWDQNSYITGQFTTK